MPQSFFSPLRLVSPQRSKLAWAFFALHCAPQIAADQTSVAAQMVANAPVVVSETRWFVVSVAQGAGSIAVSPNRRDVGAQRQNKIGYQRQVLETIGDHLRQTDTLDIVIERGGQKATLYSETMTEETIVGQPLNFAVRYRASNQETLTQGRVLADRTVQITETVNGLARPMRTLKLDPNALFPYAQIKKLRASGLKPGSTIEFIAFDPSVMLSFPVITNVQTAVQTDTFTGSKALLQVNQVMRLPNTDFPSTALVDTKFDLYQLDTEIGGLKMRLVASTRAAALAPNESSNFFIEQFAKSPRALTLAEEKGALRYRIELKNKAKTLAPQTDEQRVTANMAGGFDVLICARCGASGAGEKTSSVLALASKPTAWLQSDDSAIKAAALAQTKGKRSALDKMRALESFVGAHMSQSDLSTAYASAKEAFESKTGDCTEHALLLAAMGRAIGLPTRVVGGLAYASDYLGQHDIFVPHAWMQAYVDGHWQSFDAALGRFDAGHIALAITDGDPSSAFVGATLLGNVVIEKIDVASAANK
jgi:hypothetical protein